MVRVAVQRVAATRCRMKMAPLTLIAGHGNKSLSDRPVSGQRGGELESGRVGLTARGAIGSGCTIVAL